MYYIQNLILLRTYVNQTFGTDYPTDIIHYIFSMLKYQPIKINSYQKNNIMSIDDKIYIWRSFLNQNKNQYQIITKPIKSFSSVPYGSDDICHWNLKSKIQLIDRHKISLDLMKTTHKIHFLLQNCRLYVNDKNNQVSHLRLHNGQWYPYLYTRLNETILKIKCNNGTLFVLTQSGILYSSGDECLNCLTPNQCFDTAKILLMNVIKFNCSKTHIVVLTSDNKIHSLGIAQSRQLCYRCEYNFLPSWTEHTLPEGVVIVPKKISCGEHYTICLTTCNKLYSLGNNSYGQLGLGDCQLRNTFQQIPFTFPRIKSIHCGAYHTVVVTICNEIYVWGRNDQLGLDAETNLTIPIRLNF